MPNATKPEKKKFLVRKYFGFTDDPADDVNPYDNLPEFLEAKVGDLRWGVDQEVRKRSKMRLADKLNRALSDIYHIDLSYGDILKEVMKDDQTNEAAVDAWVEKSVFPPRP